MKKFLILVVLSLAGNVLANSNSDKLQSIGTLERFTFGSCNKQDFPQPYWKHMTDNEPQFFLMAGDNIYANAVEIKDLIKEYEVQNSRKDFQEFIKHTPIMGVWDDHDFGLNNSGSSTKDKDKRQELFLNHVREPLTSPRRQQEGIYTSYTFGVAPKKVKFILLDARYFKDTIVDGKPDLLGKKQWDWLENELANSDAQLHFIVSSITVMLNEEHRKIGEEWTDYPESRKRLFDLIAKYNPPGVIFLTGDKHYAVYLEKIENGQRYPEFMSSSLTHPAFPYWIFIEQPALALKLRLRPNYGLVDIDWNEGGPIKVKYNIMSSYTGRRVRTHTIRLGPEGWVGIK
ncbi:MAG: alkaline phosphatase family protein [Halobacteriovoraceae bacterium]|nr:alkaline phosphatase family protein [Halobacteriovoraceae bacterium]MCB9093765.1 alkaline phosphatase family protein [Halobacteriovoraceae bacterium]